jgi:hypothetical protein
MFGVRFLMLAVSCDRVRHTMCRQTCVYPRDRDLVYKNIEEAYSGNSPVVWQSLAVTCLLSVTFYNVGNRLLFTHDEKFILFGEIRDVCRFIHAVRISSPI